MAEKEPNHLFLNKKLQTLVELASDTSVIASKQSHQINDLEKEVKEIDKKIEEERLKNSDSLRSIESSLARMDEAIKNIKNGMEKVDRRFTWAKIISILITILTVSGGFITTMLIILKNLGILK